jgi:hypothetical protein
MKKKERNIRDFLCKCQEQLYKTTDMVRKVKIDRSVWKQHAGLNTKPRKNIIWKKKKEMEMPL